MRKRFKAFLTGIMVMCVVLVFSVSAYALVYSDSFYDAISWTWEYSAPDTTSYNCLGYATGSMCWEWPWTGNPDIASVTTYLSNKGYSSTGNWAQIIAYGNPWEITHFSKVTGSSWCRAKWGSLERFNHASWDPYYHSSSYGRKVKVFYQ